MSKSTRPARRILIACLSLNCWRVNKASFKRQDGPSEVGIPRSKSSVATRNNAGRAWCQEADAVNVHDFPQDAVVRAVPYGIYEVGGRRGSEYGGSSTNPP